MAIRMGHVYQEKGDTWPKILKHNYETFGDRRPAMRQKHYGIWRPFTWADYYLNVKHLALGLLAFGFEAGDRLLVIGDNAPQWYYAELAAQANRGLSVGLFAELLPAEIEYVAKHCEARFAVVEGQEQVDKLLQIKDALPHLKKMIFWNYKGLSHYDDEILVGYREAVAEGKEYEAEHPGHFERNVASGKADDACAVIYTSGTTGAAPKGAVHTHRTLRAGADYLLQRDPWNEDDNVVPYLPPVWMNEQWFGIGCHLLSACILNFAEASETHMRDSRETRPSIVFYRARVWESLAASVQARILGADALKRLAYRLSMPVGCKVADMRHRRRNPGILLKMLYRLADLFLFRSIKRSLGLSNARICYTTGAMLSPDAFKFYHALNAPLENLYGTTEGGALPCDTYDDFRSHKVGFAEPGTEFKIDHKGELFYRQPGVFVGYYKDRELTDSVLDDGWFRSGDSARVREDGRVEFVDRAGDLVKLRCGEILAPQRIESRLRFSPYIKDAWTLAGPEGAYVSVVIVIDYANVSRWAGQRRVAFTSFAELSRAPEVYELVGKDIDRVNNALPAGARVKKYVNLHKEFDPDEGELTRTRLLRRGFLEKRYSRIIDAIYLDKAAVLLETRDACRNGQSEATEAPLRIQSVEGAG